MAPQNSFGKALASADKSVRDKAVKRLSKYLSNKKDLSDLDLLKLWKGLFYCFWMSDKPLVQQQLSEKLASLILKIPDEIALKFIEAFWKEIRLEWNGVDRLRLDKFYYLFRQMHLNSFKFLEKVNWDITHVIKYMDIYTDGPLSLLDQTVPPSLLYHACEVFIPELEKAITKPIPTSVFIEVLEPFFDVVGFCSNDILVERVIEECFLNIVNTYENEDANEEEESNVVKSCNFKDIYKRFEKLSEEPNVLKKNTERIQSLMDIFKGLAETQEVLQDEDDANDEDYVENNEEETENTENGSIFEITEDDNDDDDDYEEDTKKKSKAKGRGKGKASSTKTKKVNKKKEEPIEIEDDNEEQKEQEKKPARKGKNKRKAEVKPVEIQEESEDVVEIVESPKKKRKTTKKGTNNKETKATGRGKAKAKKEEDDDVIIIAESDEEEKKKEAEPKVPNNIIKKNIKKKTNKNTKDKEMSSESSLKSKNKNNKNIKDKKVKAYKPKEEDSCQVEPVIEIDSDKPSPIILDKDLSPISPTIIDPDVTIKNHTSTSKIENNKSKSKSKTKTKTKTKKASQKKSSNEKIDSSVIDLTETPINKITKKTIKKKKTQKKEKDKLSKEEEDFVNKILRETNLLGDKSSSNSNISTNSINEKVPERIKIESLMPTEDTNKRKQI